MGKKSLYSRRSKTWAETRRSQSSFLLKQFLNKKIKNYYYDLMLFLLKNKK